MPKKTSISRGYSSRKVDLREIRQRFLIVCEGAKTEPNYFRSFRVPKLVIDIEGRGENPSRLVKSAREIQNKDEYDQVWCVFDRDSVPKQDFNNALRNGQESEFNIAYSNEAFELWYILHFEFLNTGFSRNDYKKKLSKHLDHEYQKNSEEIYDELITNQAIAIKNAENLLNQYNPQDPVDDNPSTTVHLLVKELNRFMV